MNETTAQGAAGLEALATEVAPRSVERADCDFYHVMEYPGGFVPEAQWDLRRGVDDYLGRVSVTGASVLEVGPASGYLTFEMERRGASVTCIEPPIDTVWDFVPRADTDMAVVRRDFTNHIRRIRNSFWYGHQAFASKARMFEADAYRLPQSLGRFDVGLLGAILLHTSSPLKMIESVAGRVDRTMIVTDLYHRDLVDKPICRLAPTADNGVFDTWWHFSPAFLVNFLGVVGFRAAKVTRHKQYFQSAKRWMEMFTVVARRN